MNSCQRHYLKYRDYYLARNKRYYAEHKDEILKQHRDYKQRQRSIKRALRQEEAIIREADKLILDIAPQELTRIYNLAHPLARQQQFKTQLRRAEGRLWYHKHREEILLKNAQHREEAQLRAKRWRLTLKKEVLAHYGNGELACVKCGFDADVNALTIDHINNDGSHHRRQLFNNRTGSIYKWLKDEGLPLGYQTLCGNCQLIKQAEVAYWYKLPKKT